MEKNDYDDWASMFYKVKGWPKGGLKPEKAKNALRTRKKTDPGLEKQLDEQAKGVVQDRLGGLVKGLGDRSPAKEVGDKRYKKVMEEVKEATSFARGLIAKGMVLDVRTRDALNQDVRRTLTEALEHYSSRQEEKESKRRAAKIKALGGCLQSLDNLLALDLKREEEETKARVAIQKQQLLQPGGLGDQVGSVCKDIKQQPPEESLESAKLLKTVLDDSDLIAKDVIFTGMAKTIVAPKDPKTKSKENSVEEVLATMVQGLEDPEHLNDLYAHLIDAEIGKQREGNFFRSSEACMKLAALLKELPANKLYLQKLSGEIVGDLVTTKEKWELVPNKRGEEEAHSVEETTNYYKDAVRKILIHLDPATVPPDLCRSCYEIYRAFKEKFGKEDGALNLAAGHLFIRFISPAFSSDLAKLNPTAKGMRAGVLIAKVLQNLGNGIRFGNKEQYMVPFNEVIDEYEEARIDLARQVVSRGKPK